VSLSNYEVEYLTLKKSFLKEDGRLKALIVESNEEIILTEQKKKKLIEGINDNSLATWSGRAFDELKSTLESFEISIEKPKVEVSIDMLIIECEKTLAHIEKLQIKVKSLHQQRQSLEDAYKTACLEMMKKASTEYVGFLGRYNPIFNFEYMGCTTLPQNINIGNILLDKQTELLDSLYAKHGGQLVDTPLFVEEKQHLLFLECPRDAHLEVNMENQIAALVLQFLSSFPLGSLSISVVDTAQSSLLQSIRSSLIAAGQNGLVEAKNIFANDAGVDVASISKIFVDLTNRNNSANSKMLAGGFAAFSDLHKFGDNEAFRLLVIKEGLNIFTEEMLRTLKAIISNGKTRGLFAIVVDDNIYGGQHKKSEEYERLLSEIKGLAGLVLTQNNNCWRCIGKRAALLRLPTLDNETHTIYNYCSDICDFAKKQQAESISYEDLGFGTIIPQNIDIQKSIRIPVVKEGKSKTSKTNYMDFTAEGEGVLANLIVGVPGSGKSALLETLIFNGAYMYSPNNLVFQFLDFKDGVTAQVFVDNKIPHMKVVSARNNFEDGLVILQNILDEVKRRNDLFKSRGESITSIVQYNQGIPTDEILPRIVIVIDECQEIIEGDNDNCRKFIDTILRKGRSVGIHTVLATQKFTSKMKNLLSFVDGRYIFMVDADTAQQVFKQPYLKTYSTEIPKGSYAAYYTSDAGTTFSRVYSAWVGGDDKHDIQKNRARYARAICDNYASHEIQTRVTGDDSALSLEAISEKFYRFNNVLSFPFAEDYITGELQTVSFSQTIQSSMFVLGGTNENIGSSILLSILYGASKSGYKTYLYDGAIEVEILSQFAENKEGIQKCEEDFPSFLREIYLIFSERRKNIKARHEPVFLIMNQLHSIDQIRKNEKITFSTTSSEQTGIQPTSVLEKRRQLGSNTSNDVIKATNDILQEMIEVGHSVNVFICFAENQYSSVPTQWRTVLKQCSNKVLVKGLQDISATIMESPYRHKLLNDCNDNIAVFEKGTGNLYKVRPIQYSSVDGLTVKLEVD